MLNMAQGRVVEDMWSSFREGKRLFLLEVGCSPESLLAEAAEKAGKSAYRATLCTGHDLTQPEGVRKVLRVVERERPLNVWISTECGAFSPIQNLNMKTPQQREDLKRKQREARKQHLGGLVVAYYAAKLGAHIHWEWSRRCRAWKWEHIDRWRHRMQTYTAIIGGCRVGLVDPKDGSKIGKEWRIESTSEHFARKFHLPCMGQSCEGNHTRCEGQLTRLSAFYTTGFARRAILYMSQISQEENVQRKVVMDWNKCQCGEFRDKGVVQVCPGCMMGLGKGDQAWVGEEQENSPAQEQDLTSEEKRKWLHKLDLLHSATGHGSREQLRNALQQRRVDSRIVKLVDQYRCSVCEERKRPAPRRVSTLEVHPPRWRVVLADNAVWVHPKTKQRNVIGLYMDQSSRFLVGKVLIEHKTQQPNADMYRRFFQEHWQQYFGRPETIRFDSEGAWRSRDLDECFSNLGIMMDPIPGDAHWHLSPLERSIAWIKECLSKLAGQDETVQTRQALASAIEAWNNREPCRGFSPRQHALGQVPDPCGRLFQSAVTSLPASVMGVPEGEVARAQQLRVEAEVAFTRWQAAERLSRASNSRHRRLPEYAPGDLVYYWRSHIQNSGQGTRMQTGSYSGYAGPARVLALETRRDEEGHVRPSSVAWLIRNNRLLKASVEQLRFASERERLYHEFSKPLEVPWTMTELTSPLDRETYDDISGEVPTSRDREEQGEAPRFRTPRTRMMAKRPLGAQDDENTKFEEGMEKPQPRRAADRKHQEREEKLRARRATTRKSHEIEAGLPLEARPTWRQTQRPVFGPRKWQRWQSRSSYRKAATGGNRRSKGWSPSW